MQKSLDAPRRGYSQALLLVPAGRATRPLAMLNAAKGRLAMAIMTPMPTAHWWVFLLEGIAAILVGFLLLTEPASTVVAITIFLGFYWLFVGVLELVRMFVDRSVPWIWSLLIGILGIVAGFAGGGIGSFIFGVLNLLIGILLLSSPVMATLAVPFVFGVLLLIEGVALIIWAFRVRA